MNHTDISFIPLLIVIALAFLVPILLSRFKRLAVPVVVGEIIAGIIIGQSGLNLVEDGPVLRSLSTLGFAYLMFLSGLEIDFNAIFRNRGQTEEPRWRQLAGNPITIGSVLFTLTLVGSLLAGVVLWNQNLVNDPWMMALILSTTSLGIVVPVLKERALTGNRFGQIILVTSLIADFGSILLISIYVLLLSQGLTVEILLVLILFAAFVVTHRLAVLFQKHLPTERIIEGLSSATSQIKLRGSFALALVFIALSESLGIEIILGAFLAGVIVSLLSGKQTTIYHEKVDAIGYGFLIPIFFIMVGVSFDLPALLSSSTALLLVPVLLVIAYAVKSVPALLYRFWFSWRETIGAGLLISSRLSLIIAAAAIGLEMGIISSAINSAVILIAIITCTISPILFNRLIKPPPSPRKRVIVVGPQQIGELVARRLRGHAWDAVLIQTGNGREESQGHRQPVGDSQEALLEQFRKLAADKTHTVVAIDKDDETNLRTARIARHTFGIDNLISWVNDPAKNDRFRRLGVRVLNPAFSTVLITEGMVLNPEIFSLTADMDEGHEVREVKLQNPELLDRPITALGLSDEVTVLLIERGGDILVPDEGTVVRANDTITLVGKDVDETARMFARQKENK